MTSPVSGLKETPTAWGTRLEKIMKKRKQNTQSIIQAIAAGTALLQVLAVSLVTLGFVLSANANERKTAIITFDAPGATHGLFQGLTVMLSVNRALSRAFLIPMVTMASCGLATAPSSRSTFQARV
jgi:hypothetical protein